MRANEAKDFLVQETAKQAALERVPFSDLERRMMYFTEVEEMPEDPIKLNDAFEAEYDPDEYEKKVRELMHHAYARIKKENPETARCWSEAIRELSKGDHYILVLWGEYRTYRASAGERPPYDFLKLFGTAAFLVALIVAAGVIAAHYGIDVGRHRRGTPPATQRSLPQWLQHTLIGLMVAVYTYFAIVPWIWKKRPSGLSQLMIKLFKGRSSSR